jgi:DNA processing protein
MQWNHSDLPYLMALTDLWSAGPVMQTKLYRKFGSAKAIFQASAEQLAALSLDTKLIQEIQGKNITRYLDRIPILQKKGMTVLHVKDELFPKRLKHIAHCPLLLFCRGNIELFMEQSFLAIVGSRNMTSYGEQVLVDWMPSIVQQDVVIVSGMAFGVDKTAHWTCLEGQGKTIAVQAQGIDRGYPQMNQRVFERIVGEGGLVVSEYAFIDDRKVDKFYFPRRNRILSGLSDGVFVVEAKEKSGALITAHYALEQNREVFALPGSVHQQLSKGCLRLIQQGAKAVLTPEDILSELNPSMQISLPLLDDELVNAVSFENPLEQKIHALCSDEALTLDDITMHLDDVFSKVSATVTRMQLTGSLKEMEGRRFRAG